ncbi:MAG: nitrile hydratase subunit beta [Rhizobiales bacterium]|nr:nitrile hydratase subunit beta [Hyphomicrobiales bacterium]
MNGAADMGGMHGFGQVQPEENEPVFHAEWEGHSFALNMVTGVAKLWNLDAFRFKRESLPPPQYLNLSYYGLWTAPALFKVGDTVRAKNMHPQTHTRLPRYARGHVGEVVRIVGCHVFPDSNASNAGEDPHWLYTVRFNGRELWGADSDPTLRVCIEAWEPYLEPA